MTPKPQPLKSLKFYHPAALPHLELIICILIWVGHSIYAFYRCIEVTKELTDQIPDYTRVVPILLPALGSKDDDPEWDSFIYFFFDAILPAFVIHSVVFSISTKLSPTLRIHRILTGTVDLLLHVFMFGAMPTGKVLLVCCAGVIVGRYFRHVGAAWIVGIGGMATMPQFLLAANYDVYEAYTEGSLLCMYKMVFLISYVGRFVEREETKKKSILETLEESLPFIFYLPLSTGVIFLYERYDENISISYSTPSRFVSWRLIVWRGLRLIFWACFVECTYHYAALSTINSSLALMRQLDIVSIVSVAYIAGQLFCVKYIVIFGIANLCMDVDNMQPMQAPCCISRIHLYSRIWRRFDRGLYEFLKHRVYLPFVGAAFVIRRKLLAMTLTFTFVILWHGNDVRMVKWICFNAAEVIIGMIAWNLYQIDAIRLTFEKRLSPVNIRRLLAFCQIFNICLGIFGIFHFLGGDGVGGEVGQKTWYTQIVPPTWQFGWLLVLGYAFAQTCIEIEERYENKWRLEKVKRE